jgi:C4-dicarboxylate-specific signal transduction histidine kinase
LLRRTGDTALLLLGKGKGAPDVSPKIRAMDGSAAIIQREVTRMTPFIRAKRKLDVLDPLQVLAEVREQVAPRTSKYDIGIFLPDPAETKTRILVRADFLELFQVFHNLIDNSLCWLKQRKNPAIKVRASALAGFALIVVEDNGPGIPADHVEDIFAPFWTSKPEGSGLGLPIIGEILQDYGGSLELVDNRPGKGCAFQVKIPLLKESSSDV